ncbi:TonB-dependent receptor [Asticcacaulis excentricus]|uniref:N-acetylglucosamine-regulated TonB-dependent outer membrane receptor n=1 Tax=Asticcacaulis excentricus TaxID=78587 RepID=A0A3G9G2Z0_9CAUL|nr:TonB-dependent receptor [Asticcacaulis excentricus]BBF81026.1 N-acetylglucosamine-regulated TonB-dependent outer membrane receptor [Asticcacaulis excentricus]
MQKPPSKSPKSSFAKYLMAGSGLAMLAVSGAAYAQQAAPAATDDVETVIVVGSRASQQSAIDRKKKARTATDSLVAEDVGSFPDRNLNEAISRIAGMGITRGETGEGESLSLRGNGPDLTRVEMDGMSVASSGFDLATNGTSGRASDLRELPADLIKSVDVVKGNTPDMTEGGLGGTVQIQTRTGLDFKKPYLSMRVAGDRNSLSQRWSPDINIVASRKFLDGRLGVVFNVTATRRLNDSHQLNGAGANSAAGYSRFIDFDNSPEKTFQFNPSLVSGVGATDPVSSWALASGTGNFNTLSPLEIVTRSANAKTKADCLAAFPLYTATELNTIAPGSNNGNRQAAQATRISEQVTCLNQWNDYAPNLWRDINLTQYENRLAWDVRFDYRVNDNLSVFAKYAVTNRDQEDIRRNRTRGEILRTTVAPNVTPSLLNNTNIAVGTANVLTQVANSGYYIYNAGTPTGSTTFDSTLGGSIVNNAFANMGLGANVVPGSVKVDANHYVTELDITNAGINYDNIRNDQIWDNQYLQVGGDYRNGNLRANFMASRSESTYSRYDKRFRRNALYGTGKMRVLPSGLWTVDFPAGFDPDNMENSVVLNPPAGTTPAAQALSARYSSNVGFDYSPRLVESSEDQAKFDVTYQMPDFPVLKRFKTGVSYRKILNDSWGGGGYSPKAGVFVPTNNLRGILRACENQATTSAANACVYGYVPNATTGTSFRHGTETLTRAQLVALYQNSIEYKDGPFMPDYEGVDGLSLWNSIDIDKAFSQLAGTVNYNFDCIKVCTGSDGNVYEQPVGKSDEQVTAAYYMFDFEQKLPFDMLFDGNFGVRMVQSKVAASGFVTLASTRKNITGVPATEWNPNEGVNRVTTTNIIKAVDIAREYTDWLPSYNANLWVVPDKVVLRYNWSKTVARPPIARMWPGGTCTVDERIEDLIDAGQEDLDMNCTTFGNPDLKPYTATKNNTSLEWYPNKDTTMSLAYYRQKVKVGGPEQVRVTDQPLFGGTGEVDPVTGRPLSDFLFSYNTFLNGPGYTQSGWEFASKTAFTFLPWKLRYTGMDFNISTNESKGASGYIDPITGANVGIPGRADYFSNLTVWYDDGKTNARIAYQARSRVLNCVSACGFNSDNAFAFPNQNPRNFVRLPYNPGEPYYTQEYGYLDAKLTHKLSPNVELYWEGRNLLREANVVIGSDDRGFAANDYAWSVVYGGRRFTFGLTYRMN